MTSPHHHTHTPLTIENCMSRKFVSFKPGMPVVEAAMSLVTNELIGGPVTDDDGRLVGWISEQDCLKTVMNVLYYSERVATVAKVMHPDVLTVNLSDDPIDLANQMLGAKPKIYPVVDDHGHVVGVISRRRILRAMCQRISKEWD